MYKKYALQTLSCVTVLSACTTPVAHDISHARVWYNDGYALAHKGQVSTPVAPYMPVVQAVSPQQRQANQDLYIPMPNTVQYVRPQQSGVKQSVAKMTQQNQDAYLPLIMQAENQASGLVRSVLAKGREMTLYRKEMIGGSCWDYLDAAWTRAGVNRSMRKTVFQTAKNSGEYATVDMLRPGDWIYHINHNYHDSEHSGMFIGWLDKANKIGITLSYAGENRVEPARYKAYSLQSVYNIMRAPS